MLAEIGTMTCLVLIISEVCTRVRCVIIVVAVVDVVTVVIVSCDNVEDVNFSACCRCRSARLASFKIPVPLFEPLL